MVERSIDIEPLSMLKVCDLPAPHHRAVLVPPRAVDAGENAGHNSIKFDCAHVQLHV
jgi:hypothetical protein